MNHIIKELNRINFNFDDFVIVCIGTQKSYLDSVGPIVGTKLQRLFPNAVIIGKLGDNCHALNIESKIKYIKKHYPDRTILAIDACCTKDNNKLGTIQLTKGAISPGAGVGKNLPAIGHYSFKAFTVDSARQFLIQDEILKDYEDNHKFYEFVDETVKNIVHCIKKAVFS